MVGSCLAEFQPFGVVGSFGRGAGAADNVMAVGREAE